MSDMSRRTQRRRGFSLVEMLVVIATTSVICAMATALIITMFRAEQSQSHDSNERRAIGRLGEQFRGDVHAASATPTFAESDDVLLRLPLDDDTTVTYRREGSIIIREKHHGDAVVYHDTFDVTDGWQITVEPIEPDTGAVLVRLGLVRDATTGSPAPQRWRFEAVRGSDHRHDTHVQEAE